jgi:hypothetical protein
MVGREEEENEKGGGNRKEGEDTGAVGNEEKASCGEDATEDDLEVAASSSVL